jgi:hypothetical protein
VSNYLAIATVTAALQQLLQPAVKKAVLGATVGFSRPDAGDDQKSPLVNVFLYQVTPNPALRNASLPSRSSEGMAVQRPAAALDLHYLLTFHGDHDQFEPQRLMGAVIASLQTQPILTRDLINAAVLANASLGVSNLADQVDRVQFTPTALTLDDFSKLWSAFFQVEYNLSVVYRASVVLIEPELPVRDALPVLTSNVYVTPFRAPVIERVVAASGENDPILSSSTLRIIGKQLRGTATSIILNGQEYNPATVTDSEITLPVPSGALAGVQSLQVLQPIPMGTPAVPHRGVESNAAPFVLRPSIVGATAAPNANSTIQAKITDVTLTLTPDVGAGQRALLILNSMPGNPAAGFVSVPITAPAAGNQITIPIHGVPTGTWLVRVQIAGAESPLAITAGVFSGPTVTVP